MGGPAAGATCRRSAVSWGLCSTAAERAAAVVTGTSGLSRRNTAARALPPNRSTAQPRRWKWRIIFSITSEAVERGGSYAISLFITERLFVIVKPNLMKLPWFAAAWSWFVAVRDKALRWLRTNLGLGTYRPPACVGELQPRSRSHRSRVQFAHRAAASHWQDQ